MLEYFLKSVQVWYVFLFYFSIKHTNDAKNRFNKNNAVVLLCTLNPICLYL